MQNPDRQQNMEVVPFTTRTLEKRTTTGLLGLSTATVFAVTAG